MLIDLIYSPLTPTDEYICLLRKHSLTLVLPDKLGTGEVLLLPEGAEVNPTLVGFMPEFKLPASTSPTLDMYLEFFFQYANQEEVFKYKKIVAVGASAAYLHSMMGHKLNVSKNKLELKHPKTKLPCRSYQLENIYVNLENLNVCIEEVSKFISPNGGSHGAVKPVPVPLKTL